MNRTQTTPYYILHTFPDGDAIGSSWLATRYLFPRRFPGQPITPRFMPFNQIDPEIIANATAVFDIGAAYDPLRLRFDHHQLPNPRSICATRMVWTYLTQGYKNEAPLAPELTYLQPIIDLIEAGDTDEVHEPHYRLSLTAGFHALLAGFEIQQDNQLKPAHILPLAQELTLLQKRDEAILQYGWQILDVLAQNLHRQHQTITDLGLHLVYKSDDNLVWGLMNVPPGSARAAYYQGARLIIATGHITLPSSYLVEIFSTPQPPEADVPYLVACVEEEALQTGDTAMYEELQRLYREKTYAGRGSVKAPDRTPITIDIITLAQLMDKYWQR